MSCMAVNDSCDTVQRCTSYGMYTPSKLDVWALHGSEKGGE